MGFDDQRQVDLIRQSIRLPCGLELTNRLVKAAMAPSFADRGLPTPRHKALHDQWSQDRFGLCITENVIVCPRHLATPKDVIIPQVDQHIVPPGWKAWVDACKVPTLVQLSHAGLQSPRGCKRPLGEKTVAPSSISMDLGPRIIDRVISWLLFNQAREATKEGIGRIIEQFKQGATFSHRAGFHGVQLHCSHGFLLSQFLSPITNQRQDEYGMTAANRLRILLEIIDAIRANVPESFCVSVKLTCSDLMQGGLTYEQALEYVELIVQHGGVDLIEISGGTAATFPLSNADVTSHLAPSEKAPTSDFQEAYYLNFSHQARCAIQAITARTGKPRPAVMTTGGFRSRAAMATAISEEHTDLIGIGRPACLDALVATKLLDPAFKNYTCPKPPIRGVQLWKILVPVHIVGAGFSTMWYTWQLHRMSVYRPPDLNLHVLGSLKVFLPLDAFAFAIALLVLVMLIGVAKPVFPELIALISSAIGQDAA